MITVGGEGEGSKGEIKEIEKKRDTKTKITDEGKPIQKFFRGGPRKGW